MKKITPVLAEIARCLGPGWSTKDNQNGESVGTVHGPNGMEIGLAEMGSDTWVTLLLPALIIPGFNPMLSHSVIIHHPMDSTQFAMELKTRIPEYESYYEDAKKKADQENARAECDIRIAEALRASVHAPMPLDRANGFVYWARRGGRVSVKVNRKQVAIQADGVGPGTARRILQLLGNSEEE